MDVDRSMTRLNPLVAWVLRSPLHPLLSHGLLLLEVTGRRTGRRYWIPVGYQRDGSTVTILVSRARRKAWWRNYLEPAPVRLVLRGLTVQGRARVVPAGDPAFRDAFERMLARLPALGGQFGVHYDRRTGLTAAQLETIAAGGAVVAVALD